MLIVNSQSKYCHYCNTNIFSFTQIPSGIKRTLKRRCYDPVGKIAEKAVLDCIFDNMTLYFLLPN